MLTRTFAYQGVRNVSFSENFAYVLKWMIPNFNKPDRPDNVLIRLCSYLQLRSAKKEYVFLPLPDRSC